MDPLEVEAYQVGGLVNLTGYTSTSKLLQTAINFALQECEYPQVPVILEIHFKKNTGFFEMTSEYSAYPEEEEVLVQDGLQYLITGNIEMEVENSNKKIKVIQLKYPANS